MFFLQPSCNGLILFRITLKNNRNPESGVRRGLGQLLPTALARGDDDDDDDDYGPPTKQTLKSDGLTKKRITHPRLIGWI